jgi:hypothetical protein
VQGGRDGQVSAEDLSAQKKRGAKVIGAPPFLKRCEIPS